MLILNSCVAYHVSKCQPWVSARVVGPVLESESQGVEVFGWSRIPNNTRSRRRIYLSDLESYFLSDFLSDSGSVSTVNDFLHRTSRIGILTRVC